jgi:hypothetical protein
MEQRVEDDETSTFDADLATLSFSWKERHLVFMGRVGRMGRNG